MTSDAHRQKGVWVEGLAGELWESALQERHHDDEESVGRFQRCPAPAIVQPGPLGYCSPLLRPHGQVAVDTIFPFTCKGRIRAAWGIVERIGIDGS